MATLTTFTGSVPHNYETYLGPLFFEPYAVDLANRLESQHYATVLELACGTGRLTKHLVGKLAAGGKLYATDLNEDMLRIAQTQLPDPQVAWRVADAQALPFDDNVFDLVVCQYGVMFFPDKSKAFAEVFRVLKPGGRFVFNTWDELRYNALAQLTEQALQEIFPSDAPLFFMKGPHSFFDQAEIGGLLQGAGFMQAEIEKVQKNGVAASPEDAVRGVLEGTPVSHYLAERSAEAEQVKQRLKDLLVQQYGEANLSLPMQAFVCSATKPAER